MPSLARAARESQSNPPSRHRAAVIDEIELAQQIGHAGGGARYLPPHLHTLAPVGGSGSSALAHKPWARRVQETQEAVARLERKLLARFTGLEQARFLGTVPSLGC
jgi:hypothetical protein